MQSYRNFLITIILLFCNQVFAQNLLPKKLLKDLNSYTNSSEFMDFISENDSAYILRKSDDFEKVEIYRITDNGSKIENINEIDSGPYDSFMYGGGILSITKHKNNIYYTLSASSNLGGVWKLDINTKNNARISASTDNLQNNFVINNKIFFWNDFGANLKYINESNQINNAPNLHTFQNIYEIDTLNNSFYIRAKYQNTVKWFRYSFDGSDLQELSFLPSQSGKLGLFNNHIYALINNYLKIFDLDGNEIASYSTTSYINDYFSFKFIKLSNLLYLFTGNKMIDITNPLQTPQLVQSYDNNLSELYLNKKGTYFFSFNNYIYYLKIKNLQIIELFKTDYSFSNPQKVTELLLNFNYNYGSSTHEVLTKDSSRIYLNIGQRYLYSISSGSNSVILLDSLSFESNRSRFFNKNMMVVGNKLLYQSYEPEFGTEVKITNGNNFGKTLLRDFNTISNNSYPHNFQKIDNQLFFFARNNQNELKYWKSDGTKDGTNVFMDDFIKSYINDTKNLLKVGNSYYFVDANIFFKYDSDLKRTTLLKTFSDLNTNLENQLLLFDNHVYLKGFQYSHGYTLWKSDGTPEGTTLVNNSSNTTGFLISNSKLFFFKEPSFEEAEIWELSTSNSEPILMKSIHGIIRYTYSDSNVFFFTVLQYTPSVLYQIFRSDGTNSGTFSLISNTASSGLIDSDRPMFKFKNHYYFGGVFDGNNYSYTQLWKTDATIAGTVKVTDSFIYFKNYCECNGDLYLNAYNYSNLGLELFKIDGNNGDVQMVQDINPSWNDSFPYNLRCINNKLFFNASQSSKINIFSYDKFTLTKLYEYSLDYNDPYFFNYSGFEFIGNNKIIISQYFTDKGIELAEINLNCLENLNLSSLNNSHESYSANQNISSTQKTENNAFLLYQAGKAIELQPGFKVDKNSYFVTELKGCQ